MTTKEDIREKPLKYYDVASANKTALTGVPTGSIFFETDKGIKYEYTGTEWIQTDPSQQVASVTILSSQTTSGEFDFRRYKYLAFEMPAAWTAGTLTLQGSVTAGGTKRTIRNDSNLAFTNMTVAVDTIYIVDTNALMIAALPFMSFSCSAAQTSDATIKVMMKA